MNPEQIAQLNADRTAKADAGQNPYGGTGATALSNAAGLGDSSAVTITADDLKSNVTPLKLATPQPTNTINSLNSLIATSHDASKTALSTAEQDTNALQTTLNTDASQKKSVFDQSKSDLKDLYGKIFNVQNSQQTLEDAQGITGKTQALSKATTDLEASQRNQRVALEKIYNEPGVSKEVADQRAAVVNRGYAFEQADLALVQTAANRDLTTAQSIVDHKIALQLEPLKTQLDFAKTTYADNKADMTEADNKAWQLKIKTLDNQLADEKATKTAIGNIQIEALKNGVSIPAPVLGQLNNAGSITEAASILQKNGISLQDPVEKAYKQVQMQKILSDISATGNNDPAGTLAYAQQYASTGMIPTGLPKGTFGTVAQVAKELPKPNGTLVDVNTGIKPGKLSPTQIDGFVALKDLSNKLDEAEKLYSTLSTGLIAGAAKTVFPTKDQQTYDTLRSEIVDLLGRARTGAAINASEEALYLGKVPGKFNQFMGLGTSGDTKLTGLKSSIDGKLNTGLQTNGLSIYGYSKVNIGDKQYTVGDIISNDGKTSYRVNPDGSLTQVQ